MDKMEGQICFKLTWERRVLAFGLKTINLCLSVSEKPHPGSLAIDKGFLLTFESEFFLSLFLLFLS